MQIEGRDRDTGATVEIKASHGNILANASGGKYTEAALAGRLFHSANINMVTTSTTLNTTFVGLALGNPAGSGKIVIVHEFGYAFATAAAAALVLGLAVGPVGDMANDTNAPITCAYPGKAGSVCYTDEGCASGTLVLVKIISQKADANINTYVSAPRVVDLGGSIILPAGQGVFTDTTTAAGASNAQFSFMWEEIDA